MSYPFYACSPKLPILTISLQQKEFSEKIWRRNVNWTPAHNSPSNILWIYIQLQSYFHKYHNSRRKLSRRSPGMRGLTLMLLVANLANTKRYKNLKYDWNPCIWVLIWEHSSRAIQWIPTWQGLDGFQRFLRSCAFDESSLSIGRVKRKLLTRQTVFRPWGIVCLVAECEIAVYCRYNGKIRSNLRENCRSAALKNYADQLKIKERDINVRLPSLESRIDTLFSSTFRWNPQCA